MSDSPQYATPAVTSARPPLSKAALASFVFSVLLCIPLITSLTAILLAIKGFLATKNSTASGRGFAIAGLTLGILGTLVWTVFGGLVLMLVVGSEAPRAVLHHFANNLTSGNIAAASADSDSSILPAQLDDLHKKTMPFGTYTDLTCRSINMRTGATGNVCELSGSAYFSSGTHPFNAVLKKNASGTWIIVGFHIY